MASLGYVCVVVLLASVRAVPVEDTTQIVITTTEAPKDAADACSFTDLSLRITMKALGVIENDGGRFLESGSVGLVQVLATSLPDSNLKTINEEFVKQAAKTCNSVLNDDFVDSCKRPLQIIQCLTTEYEKLTPKQA